MEITWLGQAGLLIKDTDITILADPYLSDSVEEVNPSLVRRVPVDYSFYDERPDVIICTHNHRDHADPVTLKRYLDTDYQIQVLAPQGAWETVKQIGGNHNYIRFNRHTEVTVKGYRFTAVLAEHEDIHPIGVIIEKDGIRLYITGDTLYNRDVFADIPDEIDVMFIPVNGVGNNMNMQDAKRFCEMVKPKFVVPMHCGLFDELDMNDFDCPNKIVPKFYRKINISF